MDIAEKLKSNKKSIITVASVSLSAVLLLCAFTSASGGEAAEGETLYRESTVTRGDIIVGVTETATATLKNRSVSFDVAGNIDEIFVKAGQTVKEGDPIASMATDGIEEELAELSTSYQEAVLKLSEAELAKQKGEIDAKNTYDSTLSKSGTADATYALSSDKLERSVAEAEDNILEIKKEIYTYKIVLGYSFGEYEYDYDTDYDYTNSSLYSATYASKSFKDEDEVEAAIEDARKRLTSAEAALTEAKYNLEIQLPEADLTKDQTTSKADLAETVYEMELQSLQNGVTSKALEVTKLQDQIDKYQGYLEQNVLMAPCDGIVTAVSGSEGDAIQADSAVATVSDSDNVFVYIAVTQDDITGISMGQECTVSMDAFEEIAFVGTVDSITTTPARNASGSASYNVTIQLAGDTAQVYEGMTGSATLITRQQKDVLYVTSRTIYTKDSGSYVKVKREDGAIEEVPVTTGFSDGRNVEITSGLEEGWTVLIESQVAAGT